jgi:hypothetical protein
VKLRATYFHFVFFVLLQYLKYQLERALQYMPLLYGFDVGRQAHQFSQMKVKLA